MCPRAHRMRSSLSLRCCEHQTCTSAGARRGFRRLRFRERAWPSLLMRGALAALSPCSWDLMPRHLCGRSILSDGASPPAAPSLFGWHRICVCAILAVAGDCSGQQYTMGGGLVCRACGALVVASALPRRLVHLAARGGGPTAHSWCCCCITSRGAVSYTHLTLPTT